MNNKETITLFGVFLVLVTLVCAPIDVVSTPVQQFHGVLLNRRIFYDSTTFVADYEDNFSFPTDLLQNYNHELKINLPSDFANRIISFPKNFSFYSNVNVTVKLKESNNGTSFSILLPPVSQYPNLFYYNLSISYRLFLKPETQGYVFNVSLPYSFETNFKVDAFSVEIYSQKGTFISVPQEFNLVSSNTTDIIYKSSIVSNNMSFKKVELLQSYNFKNNYIYKAFTKTIQINPLLGIKVSDKYSIQTSPLLMAFGGQAIPLPTVYLPRWIQSVHTEDALGPIDFSQSYVANTSLIAINTKSRFSLMPGSNYSFITVYFIPLQNTSRNGDLWEIVVPFSSNVSQVLPYFDLEISLPIGASLRAITINDTSINFKEVSLGKYEAQIKNLFIGSSPTSTMKVLVNYPILWAGYPISMLVLLSGLFVFAVYYVSKIKVRSQKVQEKITKKEYPEISQLKKVLRSYLDDYMRITELEYRYFEGKISRREFKSVHDKMRGDIGRYEREISRLLSTIRGSYPEFTAKIKNVENLVLSLQTKGASFREMGTSYINKRIMKESFKEYAKKTIDEITELVDKIRSEAEML
ncbi:MAG: hypothetical protein JTT16_03805 [Candidatus Brockarchaeota archaeon]|nr:hypothetical protein [Candidatus Brockarchaeota archaeon]MBO3768418.1 hypothetical protein [Candidatus Brockarchaeota archaeon]